MLLDLVKLSIDELNEKLSTLHGRMRHLEIAGSHGSNAYAQCLVWIQQINYELEERNFLTQVEDDPNWKSGLVATIGEPEPEEEKTNGEKKRSKNSIYFKRSTS